MSAILVDCHATSGPAGSYKAATDGSPLLQVVPPLQGSECGIKSFQNTIGPTSAQYSLQTTIRT